MGNLIRPLVLGP